MAAVATGWGLAGALVLALMVPAGLAQAAPEASIRPLPRPAETRPVAAAPRRDEGRRLQATVEALKAAQDGAAVAAVPAAQVAPAAEGAAAAAVPVPEPAPPAEAAPVPLPEPFVFAHPDESRVALAAPQPRRNGAAGAWADADGPDLRPRRRADAPAVAMAAAATPTLGALFLSALRPEPRPGARRAAPFAPTSPEAVEPAAVIRPAPGASAPVSRRGSVCGVPEIRGEALAPIVGRVKGCGVAQPVRVSAVGGVRLSEAAVMDCDTARALHAWVERGLQPAFRGEVTALQVAGHYVCRTRNHQRGARLSEHSRGKAIDISGIVLRSGQSLSIRNDWRGRNGPAIKAAHRAACGIFGTTLGPGSDGMHEDHLHFDTAVQRNGPYCR